MKTDPTLSPDEASLHALVDGRLPAEARDALRQRLAADPSMAATVQAWQSQRERLHRLHEDVLREPVPAALQQAARQIGLERRRIDRWQRWGGLAASVLLAFGAGWIAHGQWPVMAGGTVAKARAGAEFGHQAVVAHVVYAPEVRHPVEVAAAQQEHLVQWLSKRLGRPLKVPDLTTEGYELVGGRLLPGDQGARAQFMFQNGRGERLTLYVGAVDGAMPAGETVFRFTSEAGTSSFYWVDQGFGYALAGKLARPDLLALAEAVYKQI
jgi:anti-sigma factor RsiW